MVECGGKPPIDCTLGNASCYSLWSCMAAGEAAGRGHILLFRVNELFVWRVGWSIDRTSISCLFLILCYRIDPNKLKSRLVSIPDVKYSSNAKGFPYVGWHPRRRFIHNQQSYLSVPSPKTIISSHTVVVVEIENVCNVHIRSTVTCRIANILLLSTGA